MIEWIELKLKRSSVITVFLCRYYSIDQMLNLLFQAIRSFSLLSLNAGVCWNRRVEKLEGKKLYWYLFNFCWLAALFACPTTWFSMLKKELIFLYEVY